MYERYCALRDDLNLRDADVANRTHISKSTFVDWKKGKSKPNAEKLLKIAKVLGTNVEYLMTGKAPAEYAEAGFDPEIIALARKVLNNEELRILVDLEKDMTESDLTTMLSMARVLTREHSEELTPLGE